MRKIPSIRQESPVVGSQHHLRTYCKASRQKFTCHWRPTVCSWRHSSSTVFCPGATPLYWPTDELARQRRHSLRWCVEQPSTYMLLRGGLTAADRSSLSRRLEVEETKTQLGDRYERHGPHFCPTMSGSRGRLPATARGVLVRTSATASALRVVTHAPDVQGTMWWVSSGVPLPVWSREGSG